MNLGTERDLYVVHEMIGNGLVCLRTAAGGSPLFENADWKHIFNNHGYSSSNHKYPCSSRGRVRSPNEVISLSPPRVTSRSMCTMPIQTLVLAVFATDGPAQLKSKTKDIRISEATGCPSLTAGRNRQRITASRAALSSRT